MDRLKRKLDEVMHLLYEEQEKSKHLRVKNRRLKEELKKKEDYYFTITMALAKGGGGPTSDGPNEFRIPQAGPSRGREGGFPPFTRSSEPKIRRHGREKGRKTKCICGQTFGTEKERNAHVFEKVRGKIKCNVTGCRETFSHPIDATSHKKKDHGGHEPHVCGLCKQFFNSAYENMSHRKDGGCYAKKILSGKGYESIRVPDENPYSPVSTDDDGEM